MSVNVILDVGFLFFFPRTISHQHQPVRIYGQGPARLQADSVAAFYRYNSGTREFQKMTTSDFAICDGLALKASSWPRAPPGRH
jgi:hypothetical protein